MKTAFNKANLILAGLVLLGSGTMKAGISDKFKEFVGNEFSSFQGLYIMAGVIISGLVLYVFVNHFGKEESDERRGMGHVSHRRHRHHHRIIKKTS
jgi:hypothetical protein